MGNKGIAIIGLRRARKLEMNGVGTCTIIELVIAEKGADMNMYYYPYTIRYAHDTRPQEANKQ